MQMRGKNIEAGLLKQYEYWLHICIFALVFSFEGVAASVNFQVKL